MCVCVCICCEFIKKENKQQITFALFLQIFPFIHTEERRVYQISCV